MAVWRDDARPGHRPLSLSCHCTATPQCVCVCRVHPRLLHAGANKQRLETNIRQQLQPGEVPAGSPLYMDESVAAEAAA